MARRRPTPAGAAPTPPPPPLTPSPTRQFGRDLERLRKRGEDLDKLQAVIERLCAREPLPPQFSDHPLKGDWKGWRDCHVAADWLLIYRSTSTELLLARTGTHADLFE